MKVMKRKSGLILAMASMMCAAYDARQSTNRLSTAMGNSSITEDEKMINKGLKKFYMGNDIYVWALNEKNAIRKYNKMKL